VAVYKRGSRWHYRFQVGGQKISGTAGAAGSKADAVALEAKLRADILAGRIGKTPEHYLDDALRRWLSGEASRLRSYPAVVSQVRAIMAHSAITPISQIVAVAERVKQSGLDSGLAIATINRRLAALRRVAFLAHDQWGWLSEQLGQRIKLLPGEVKRHTYLTPEQVENIADCCEHQVVALAIRLSARTGLRQGELLQADTIVDGFISIGPEISKPASRAWCRCRLTWPTWCYRLGCRTRLCARTLSERGRKPACRRYTGTIFATPRRAGGRSLAPPWCCCAICSDTLQLPRHRATRT